MQEFYDQQEAEQRLEKSDIRLELVAFDENLQSAREVTSKVERFAHVFDPSCVEWALKFRDVIDAALHWTLECDEVYL